MNPFDVPTVGIDELPADAFVLDVREPHEWHSGHIESAVHVPMNSVPATVSYEPARIPSDRRVYVVCAMGGRSAHVTAWLRGNGFDAVNVAGGMDAWCGSGRPVARASGR